MSANAASFLKLVAQYTLCNKNAIGDAFHFLFESEVQVGPDKLEVVASFCYLGDMLSAGGGCEMAVTTRVKTAWKKFRELLPVLTSRHLS